MRTNMNNEMNEKKAVTLEDLLMELVKEGKAVRIPIGKAAIQLDKAEANKEQEALKLDKPQAVPSTIHIENLHIHLDERMISYNSFQSENEPEDAGEEELPDIDVDEMLAQIKQKTGMCMKSILAVLEAEHKYLDSIWGTDDDDSDEEDNA